MRLTLRTLLAYMDDILEPEDREDLRAKIEHAEFASDLMHRARDVMRRLRLGAPAVTDPKKGTDANSVAEYLDNTMPPEQVADFERLCLESDIQLAEVASCHQILTMVLGEPADVRPESRARMYGIPLQADLPPAGAADGEAVPPPAQSPRGEVPQIDVHRRPAPQVPDYLRESFVERHRGKLVLAALVLIAGLAIVLWPSGEVEVPTEVAQRDLDEQIEPPVVDEGDVGDGADEAVAGAPVPGDAAEENELMEAPQFESAADDATTVAGQSAPIGGDADLPPEGTDTSDIPRLPETLAGLAEQETGAIDPQAGPPDDSGESIRLPDNIGIDTGTEPDLPAAPVPDVQLASPDPVASDGGAVPDAGTGGVGAEDVATATGPIPGEQAADASIAADGQSEGTGDAEEVTTATAVVSESPQTPEPQHVATYVSRGEMLLRYDEASDAWIRLAPLAQLHEGDELMALPASRPIITLPMTNLSIQLQPETRVVLDAGGFPNLGGDEAPAGLTVRYGRVVMFNPAQSGNWVSVQVQLGETVYGAELEGGSTLALDVRRELPPGVNPLEHAGDLVVNLYAASGQVRWRSGDVAQTIDSPSHWQIVGDQLGAVEPLSDEPRWISEDTSSAADRLALGVVEPAIAIAQPARLSLAELAQSKILQRRREVKALATRASVHVGDFEPFVKALNDASQNQVWDEHIATLRRAMALGPQVAERIREAFRNYKGQEVGDALFRLLWGYSKSQLENAGLEQLVEYLDNESLDVRVLAFNNLYRATGKQLEYKPHDRLQLREGPVREWRRRLMDGDLEIRPQGTRT